LQPKHSGETSSPELPSFCFRIIPPESMHV
jgi:hypothetical protein